jgi:predicted PurR-regulated permease PerM/methylmalonyl-CoA mutase cobalamin-binding subunit
MFLAKPAVKPAWQRAVITMSAAVTTAVLVAAVYWMRALFIPIALAVFFTYVLAPLVTFTQRRGLGRVWAVVLVVTLAVTVFGGTVAVIGRELTGLSETLVENKDRIVGKLTAARRAVLGDGESRWANIGAEFERAIFPTPADPPAGSVVVEPASPSWLTRLNGIAGPATEAVGQAAFAFILVVFMLLAKEDLQDRMMRLIGDGGMTSATRATGEAGRRISRYLFTQLTVNVAFGLLCTAGLLLLGVPYAPLWGFIGTLMRYVPYIGTWVGVLLPAGFAFAVSDSWVQPAGVLAVFLGLELIGNNLVEPRLYGQSLGVSEVALLVSAGVWSFLWGPIGLILSGPITTCLAAVGKHLPPLRFLHVLLGTEPPLTPPVALFQRLMARNQDEAVRVVTDAVPPDAPEKVFDDTVVPALSLLVQARREGQFDGDEERLVFSLAGEVIDELVQEVRSRDEQTVAATDEPLRLLACPAADEAERLSLEALTAIIPAGRWEVRVTPVDTLTSESVAAAVEFAPHVVCVASLPPHGLAHVRYLCKRLRSRLPNAYLLVGRWGEADIDVVSPVLTEAGASAVTNTLLDARNRLGGYSPVFADRGSVSVVPGTPTAAVAVGTTPA